MKRCKACSEDKPETEFHKDRSKPDGLNAYCKPCTIAKQSDYQRRPPRRQDPSGLKTCAHCKALKPLSDYHAEARRFDGLNRVCKVCSAESHRSWLARNPSKNAELQKRWRDNNPERSADHNLKKLYGLPIGTYDKMFAAQEGRCAICKTDDTGKHRRFHVDHCHETGKVRGLLCHGCNVSLGHYKHSIDILQAAITYLAESGTEG